MRLRSELVEKTPVRTEYAAGAGDVFARDEGALLLVENGSRRLGYGADVGDFALRRFGH